MIAFFSVLKTIIVIFPFAKVFRSLSGFSTLKHIPAYKAVQDKTKDNLFETLPSNLLCGITVPLKYALKIRLV